MPLTNEELIGYRQNRRQAILKVLTVLFSLVVVAAMVILVLRLVNRHSKNTLRAQVTADQERQDYEANISAARPRRDDLPANQNYSTRESISDIGALDMTVRKTPPRTATPLEEGIPVEKSIENIEMKQAAIAEVLRQFFEARTVVNLIPLVRDSRRVRPLMDEYYQRIPLKARAWKGIGWTIPVEEPGYRFAYVQATFRDLPPINLVVEETSSGFLVDWESSVQYSEMGWKDFMSTKPAQPKLFRIFASRAEGSTVSGVVLTLKHPHEDGTVSARFDPGDASFRPLMEQLEHSKWKDVSLILRLSYPSSATESDEVQIAGVVGKGWLVLEDRSRGS